MIYSKQITTVKNTVKANALKTVIKVTTGLVYRVEFDFPQGSAGLMGVCVFDKGYQVWPSELGEFFTGDGVAIGFDDIYLKESQPCQFDVYTYNLDDSYNHLLNIRIGLVTQRMYMARYLPHLAYEDFVELLRGLSNEQAALLQQQKQSVIENPFSWLQGEKET